MKEAVSSLLLSVGLDPSMEGNYPHEFSGGQRQRIVLARALSLKPSLIVLDEPVSGLDVSVQAQVMNLLQDLRAEHGLTYLLIAHDLATVRYLCDTLAVMYLGKLLEVGPSASLFEASQHPYTRLLVSTAGRNLPRGWSAASLANEIPSPADVPPGCRFRTRCWLYEKLGKPERCEAEEPPLRPVDGTGHVSACHFAEAVMEAA